MTTYFIHGFLEDNSMWDSIGFPANIQPRFIELPGHGRKLKDSCPNNMTEIAHFVAQEISESSYNIVGHSMGGYLMGSLLEIGIRPQKIGLFHSKLGEDSIDKKLQRMRAIELVKENKELYVNTMISNLFSDTYKEKMASSISSLVNEAKKVSVETIIHCHQSMMHRGDGIHHVKELAIPAYYFSGKKDQSVPLHQIEEEVQTLAPLAHLTSHPEMGHMGQWEDPTAVEQWLHFFND
jgi:pimeloyl-ACP methyl ester carboxylesterase